MNKHFTTIVLTGGPHAGKSETLKALKEFFNKTEWKAIFINETATEVMETGFDRQGWNCNYDFENTLFTMQIYKEELYKEAAEKQQTDKIVFILDRSLLDVKGYSSPAEWSGICREHMTDEDKLLKRYDCIIHLDTHTTGYDDGSNPVRFENEQEAVKMNDVMWKIYEKHPRHYRVCAKDCFDEKVDEIIKIMKKEIEERYCLIN